MASCNIIEGVYYRLRECQNHVIFPLLEKDNIEYKVIEMTETTDRIDGIVCTKYTFNDLLYFHMAIYMAVPNSRMYDPAQTVSPVSFNRCHDTVDFVHLNIAYRVFRVEYCVFRYSIGTRTLTGYAMFKRTNNLQYDVPPAGNVFAVIHVFLAGDACFYKIGPVRNAFLCCKLFKGCGRLV